PAPARAGCRAAPPGPHWTDCASRSSFPTPEASPPGILLRALTLPPPVRHPQDVAFQLLTTPLGPLGPALPCIPIGCRLYQKGRTLVKENFYFSVDARGEFLARPWRRSLSH